MKNGMRRNTSEDLGRHSLLTYAPPRIFVSSNVTAIARAQAGYGPLWIGLTNGGGIRASIQAPGGVYPYNITQNDVLTVLPVSLTCMLPQQCCVLNNRMPGIQTRCRASARRLNPESHNGPGGARHRLDLFLIIHPVVASQFGNYISVQLVTGQQLIDALENGVSQVESGAGRFPQVRPAYVSHGFRTFTISYRIKKLCKPVNTSLVRYTRPEVASHPDTIP